MERDSISHKHLRTCTRIERATAAVYKYGNHLTPGLIEVRGATAAALTSFLAGDLAGIPTLKTS